MMGSGNRGVFCRRVLTWARVGLCVLVGGRCASPQAQDDDAAHTLHVYVNTIQIPVLVLEPDGERLKQLIAADRFSVSLDSGPWFRATHVRPEGEDPISLAIVLDTSGYTAELMPKMSAAIADLASESLHAQDRVSIYAMDCALIHAVSGIPADRARLRQAVDSALGSSAILKKGSHATACEQEGHLWDTLLYVTSELGKEPGRRVILAITDGRDRGSRQGWNELRYYAQANGVAVFGVTWISELLERYYAAWRGHSENVFNSVCQLTGGIVQRTTEENFGETLKRFLVMVRERYIIEFPRPYNSTAGSHGLLVRIDKGDRNFFIRAAGISVPIADAATRADPNTVPEDPTRTPEQGKRKILAPQ